MTKLIFPLPVKRCRNKATGLLRNVEDMPQLGSFAKIFEELSEAATEGSRLITAWHEKDNESLKIASKMMALELVDTITACITLLEIAGYDATMRQELYKAVNDKNRARGYLDD